MRCNLCSPPTDDILYTDSHLLVVLVTNEPDYPGFCRVIWKAHVKEMTDLAANARQHLMNWVFWTEAALRAEMQPAKINLASLGNRVPHLHWHVIPRFVDDAHFPDAIWAKPQRASPTRHSIPLAERLRHRLCQLASVPEELKISTANT